MTRDAPAEIETVTPDPADKPDPSADAKTEDSDVPDEEPEKQPEPVKTQPKTTQPKTTSGSGSSGSGSSGRTSGTSSPRKTGTTVSTEPAEPVANEDATGGDYTVRFVAQGAEATLECFDGRDKVEFVNATRQTFTGVVTCRVHIDGSMGVVQVKQEGTVACVASGGSVSCAAQ